MLAFYRTLGLYVFFSTAILQGNIKQSQTDLDTRHEEFEEKVYLHPSQIHIAQNGLFLNLYDQLIPLISIQSDNMGIYIYERDIELRALYWTCKNGHTNHRSDYPTCIFCNAGP